MGGQKERRERREGGREEGKKKGREGGKGGREREGEGGKEDQGGIERKREKEGGRKQGSEGGRNLSWDLDIWQSKLILNGKKKIKLILEFLVIYWLLFGENCWLIDGNLFLAKGFIL